MQISATSPRRAESALEDIHLLDGLRLTLEKHSRIPDRQPGGLPSLRPPSPRWYSTERFLISVDVTSSLVTFFFFCCATWLAGSYFPEQGSNPCPRQWKHGVLNSGPPGNSQASSLSTLTFPFLQCRGTSSRTGGPSGGMAGALFTPSLLWLFSALYRLLKISTTMPWLQG